MSGNTKTVHGIDATGWNKFDLCNQIIFYIWSWAKKFNFRITKTYIRREKLNADVEYLKEQKYLE